MFDAVLFDLDGTLLPVDTDQFLKRYLELIANATRPYIEPQKFVAELMKATYQMITNLEAHKTNEEVFVEHFFAQTKLDPAELMPVFEEFYIKDFHQLASICRTDVLVPKIIQTALARFPVVIATNPVFPRIAIEERLQWVGIAGHPYALVTSYEIMHYCKPQIEYYLEIVDMLQVAPERCLMIGNDIEEDLIAREIGMKTFLVDTYLINRQNAPFVTDYRGNLRKLYKFLTSLN